MKDINEVIDAIDEIKVIHEMEYDFLKARLGAAKRVDIKWDIAQGDGKTTDELEALHDLSRTIKQCLTVLYVYDRDKGIAPGYALEKIFDAQRNINEAITLFSKKENESEEQEDGD